MRKNSRYQQFSKTASWFWISVQNVPKWRSDMTHTFQVGTPCGSVCNDEEKFLGVLPVSSQWLWRWYPRGKKEWLLRPPSFSLKPVVYSGTREQRIHQWYFSMAVNKYAWSYKQLKSAFHLLMFAKVCTEYLYKSLIQMYLCAFKLKMCPHTYSIMWCSHSQQEHPILGCTKPYKSNLAYVLPLTTTKFY